MVRRYFFKAQRDRRYYNHHYKDETYEGIFEAKIEKASLSLLQAVKKIFRKIVK
jgi:hypothetical protein